MRLVFAGTPQVAVPALEALAASRHDVVAVLTRPDAPAGRGRSLSRSPVAQWADQHEVPVLTPQRPAEPAFLEALTALAPDCCPVVAYGALVPTAALVIPRHGWVNLHFSLLPAWRGAAPVQRAVMAGDEVTGATTFRLEEGLDTGPVYGVLTERVRPDDTSGDLLARLSEAGAGLLVATLDGIAGLDGTTLDPQPQPLDGVSLAPKVSVDEARVDWTLPAMAIDRRIRGCTPQPGAWTTWRGERLKLGPVRAAGLEDLAAARGSAAAAGGAGGGADASATGGLAPGELVAGRNRVVVGTATQPVVLQHVQPHGKKAMAAADWARGVRAVAGERLS